MTKFYLIILFIIPIIHNSQNLVLNPSLEEYDTKLKYPKYWQRVTLTPDIYTKDKIKGFSELKKTGYYPQHMFNDFLSNTFGENYIGIVTSETGFGEMIGGLLKSPLQKDMLYTVKMKAIRSKSFGVIPWRTVNVLLTDKQLPVTSKDSVVIYNLPFIYPYKIDSSEIISKDEWFDISTNYIAMGGEKYIYLNSQKLTKTKGILTVCLDSISVYPTNIFVNKPLVIDSIFFEVGKDKLTNESQKRLDKLISIFNSSQELKIKINGHTDNQGNQEKNMELSVNRSKSVMNYLVSKGISKNRLSFVGYGDKKPIADNTTDAGRAKNRRIEFELTK